MNVTSVSLVLYWKARKYYYFFHTTLCPREILWKFYAFSSSWIEMSILLCSYRYDAVIHSYWPSCYEWCAVVGAIQRVNRFFSRRLTQTSTSPYIVLNVEKECSRFGVRRCLFSYLARIICAPFMFIVSHFQRLTSRSSSLQCVFCGFVTFTTKKMYHFFHFFTIYSSSILSIKSAWFSSIILLGSFSAINSSIYVNVFVDTIILKI